MNINEYELSRTIYNLRHDLKTMREQRDAAREQVKVEQAKTAAVTRDFLAAQSEAERLWSMLANKEV